MKIHTQNPQDKFNTAIDNLQLAYMKSEGKNAFSLENIPSSIQDLLTSFFDAVREKNTTVQEKLDQKVQERSDTTKHQENSIRNVMTAYIAYYNTGC